MEHGIALSAEETESLECTGGFWWQSSGSSVYWDLYVYGLMLRGSTVPIRDLTLYWVFWGAQNYTGPPLGSSSGNFSLSTAFKIFDIIHRITTSHETISAISREVVSDFADDGVRYLELRTTPKVQR